MRKKLTETTMLRGFIEKITMMDLRKSPGDIIEQVQMGKIFIVSKAGKDVAVLQALPGESLTLFISPKGKRDYLPSSLSKGGQS